MNTSTPSKSEVTPGKVSLTSVRQSPVQMGNPSQPQPELDSNLSTKLYTALRKLRTTLLKEAPEGVNAYHIFRNSTLEQISKRIPRTKEELLEIHGIGEVKVNRYGDRVLETVEAVLKELYEIEENNSSSKTAATPAKGSLTIGRQSPPQIGSPSHPQPEVHSDLSTKLYTALQRLRTILLKEAGEGVIAYNIFRNDTLDRISKRFPKTKKELLEIHGIGDVKVNKYGDRLLETIEATLTEHCKTEEKCSSSKFEATPAKGLQTSGGKSSPLIGNPSHPQLEVTSDLSAELYIALRSLRTILLKEAGEGFSAYHIFTNGTLDQISKRIPRTKDELLEIHGIGDVKVNKYGDRLLETIEATLKENYKSEKNSSSVKSEASPAKGSPTSGRLSPPQIEKPSQPQPEVDSVLSTKLYAALRRLRTILLKEAGEGVLAYHIFGNATMDQISKRIPRSKDKLLEIHGIGDLKVNKYGNQLLETIEATVKEHYETEENSNSIKSEATPRIENPSQPQPEVDSDLSTKLYTALRRLRTILLKEAGKGVAPYHIFGNATLLQISQRIPRTKDELLEIHGIGKAKLNKYGDQLLETIEATIKEHPMTKKNNPPSNDSLDSVKRKRDTARVMNADSEDDNEFMESTGRSKKRVVKEENDHSDP